MNREHRAMRLCKCTDADRLSFVCLRCGSVKLWDPAWLIIVGAVALFSWNLWTWVTL